MDAPLVVIHAGNSQGKTSLAEALEFLLSGCSSRRELLGGAKAEYNDSLRNAHLPPGDDDVYVAAGIRAVDGTVNEVRRELITDFAAGTECHSRLLVDGGEAADLSALGLAPADPPVRAPVLLQHILATCSPQSRSNASGASRHSCPSPIWTSSGTTSPPRGKPEKTLDPVR